MGPITFGEKLDGVEKLLGSKVRPERPFVGTEDCYFATADSMPGGVAIMVESGRVVAAYINDPDIATFSGARVGMTTPELLAMYPGQIEVRPHPYGADHGAKWLVLHGKHSKNRGFVVVFETDGHHVVSFHAGATPAALYPEGCS